MIFAFPFVVCRDIKTLSNVKNICFKQLKIKTKANDLEYFHSDQEDLKMFFHPNIENRRCYSRTEITDESNWFLNVFLFGNGFMLLWFTDLMNVTEEVTIYRPNVSTLLVPSSWVI